MEGRDYKKKTGMMECTPSQQLKIEKGQSTQFCQWVRDYKDNSRMSFWRERREWK